MFWHNFKYTLKTLFRNKILIFWTFAFPILLGIFFHMAFSNIENSEKFEPIAIAIVENDNFQKDKVFKAMWNSINQNKKKIFDTTYTSLKKAKEKLEKKEITGYLIFKENNIQITVNENGINETILKNIMDEVKTNNEIINDIAKKRIQKEIERGNQNIDYENIYKETALSISKNHINIQNISNKNLSYTMIEYYTLIAMTCLYGGILSMFITNFRLANMSAAGKRTSISPIHKIKILLGSLFASYIVQMIGVILLFLFTIFVLKVDYGNNLIHVIVITFLGSFAGLSLGIATATLVKANENTKIGILIAITMLGCFLSGMMGISMKYIIDKNIPILNKINPANMITDGLYSLYYYDTFDRFIQNVIYLLLFSILMIGISYTSLRRQKYDSI